MSWQIAWSVVAERDLLALPWRTAALVDRAVLAFAAGRASDARIERVSATDATRVRLRLPAASALLWLDRKAGIVYVARVLANTL